MAKLVLTSVLQPKQNLFNFFIAPSKGFCYLLTFYTFMYIDIVLCLCNMIVLYEYGNLRYVTTF